MVTPHPYPVLSWQASSVIHFSTEGKSVTVPSATRTLGLNPSVYCPQQRPSEMASTGPTCAERVQTTKGNPQAKSAESAIPKPHVGPEQARPPTPAFADVQAQLDKTRQFAGRGGRKQTCHLAIASASWIPLSFSCCVVVARICSVTLGQSEP